MERVQIAALIVSGAPRRSAKTPAGADPLGPIAGLSQLTWVIDAAVAASIRRVAIVADPPDASTRAELESRSDRALVEFVPRRNDSLEDLALAIDRLGSDLTLSDNTHLLVLSAEAPQIEAGELRALLDDHISSDAAATVLGSSSRSSDRLAEPIVERDSTGQISAILDPISTEDPRGGSVAVVRASLLIPALRRVTPTGWTSEPLLVDALVALEAAGHTVVWLPRAAPIVTVASMASRAAIEVELRDRIIASWIDRGVSMPDPRQVTIDATVAIGQGVEILPGTVIEGATVVGDGAVLGPNSHLVNASVGTGARVPSAVVDGADVEPHELVDPFSVLRGDTT